MKIMLCIPRIVAVLLIIALSFQIMPVLPVYAIGITFEDPQVEQTIREQLKIPSDSITQEDMKKVIVLSINSKKVSSLKGLEYAINLVQADFNNNNITDLSPLASLTKLYSLTLENNQISDLQPLSGLKSLTYLDLAHNKLHDLTTASLLISVTRLILSDNNIMDISPLASLTNLDDLSLARNQIKDVRTLAGLTALKRLDLSSNKLNDLTTVAPLTNLIHLVVAENHIRDIVDIKNFHQLRLLDISSNLVESIEEVRSMPELIDLYIDHNNVHDIDPLKDLTHLQFLKASNNVLNFNDEATKAIYDSLVQRKVIQYDKIITQRNTALKYTKTDKLLLSWSHENTHNDVATRDYAYGNGLYVAVGQDGLMKTSKDGLQWQEQWTGFSGDFNSVTWGNGLFIAFGQSRMGSGITTWSSVDGIQWTKNPLIVDWGISIYDVTWNGKRFVAVGGNLSAGFVTTSEDGINWTKRISGIATALSAVAWGNGTFVALGMEGKVVSLSKDGITWKKVGTSAPIDDSMWSLTFGGGVFVAVGDYMILTSKDGEKWTHVPSQVFWSRIFWVKDRFFLMGGKWVDYAKKDDWLNLTWTSKDGIKWSDTAFVNNPQLFQYPLYTLHNGKQFVTVTTRGLETSANGKDWQQFKSYPISMVNLSQAAKANGKLLIVGGDKDHDDGMKLSNMVSLQLDSTGQWAGSDTRRTYPFINVMWTGKEYFGIGFHGKMMSSKDGLSWKPLTSPTKETLTKAIMANGTYYVTGYKGLILSSKDGINWAKQKTNVYDNINSIEWNGKTFVAVGTSGLILVSLDGSTWTKVISNNKGDYSDIVWAKNNFVVTGNHYIDDVIITKSPDGYNWSYSIFNSGDSMRYNSSGLYAVTIVGDLYISVGSLGSVYLSDDGENWTKQPIMIQGDWYGAAEIGGKVYVFGQSGRMISADLNSFHVVNE